MLTLSLALSLCRHISVDFDFSCCQTQRFSLRSHCLREFILLRHRRRIVGVKGAYLTIVKFNTFNLVEL